MKIPEQVYDCIVVGGGPAGLTAATHLADKGYRCAVIEQSVTGGHLIKVMRITDYPGIDETSGYAFAAQLTARAESAGAKLLSGTRAVALRHEDTEFSLVTDNRGTLTSRSVLVAAGQHEITTGLPEENNYRGKGVSYCAECDGSFFRNKPVMVYGDGPGANDAVSLLAQSAGTVYHVIPSAAFIGEEPAGSRGKSVRKLFGWHLKRLEGSPVLSMVELQSSTEDKAIRIDCNGLFVYLGTALSDELLQPFHTKDPDLGITALTNGDLASEGLFTAGHLDENGSLVEICADGRKKAAMIVSFLNKRA